MLTLNILQLKYDKWKLKLSFVIKVNLPDSITS